MKRILIALEDKVHAKHMKLKGKMTWEQYLTRVKQNEETR